VAKGKVLAWQSAKCRWVISFAAGREPNRMILMCESAIARIVVLSILTSIGRDRGIDSVKTGVEAGVGKKKYDDISLKQAHGKG